MRRMSEREFNGPRFGCPDEMRLAAYVDGGLTAEDRAKLERHLSECSYCLGQVSAAARLEAAETPEVPAALMMRARDLVEPAKRSSGFGWRWATGSALAACMAILLVVLVRTPKQPPAEAVRATVPPATSLRLVAPEEGAGVSREAVEFRWQAVEGALSYRVRLLTDDGSMVWETQTAETHISPPAGLPLATGEKYFVSASATLPDGRTVKSAFVGFRVLKQ